MYSPRIEPDKVERLYKLKDAIRSTGEKTDMIKLVDQALEQYLPVKEEEVRRRLASTQEVNDAR